MKITELKSIQIKKNLCAASVRFRWHNKNNTGGNFGINVIGVKGKNYEISGRYNCEGTLRCLRFGFINEVGIPMNVNSIEEMFEFINKIIEKHG